MTSKVFDLSERQQKGAAADAESTDNSVRTRTPWNGSLAEAELDMPGGLLLAALTACANSRGHHFTQMAAELGVTYGYIAQLRNGNREVDQVSDEFALACARYLVVPRMTVLMLAGRITPADVFESDEMVATEVTRAFEYLCTDPQWGPMVTAEMRKASTETQFGIVRLYEKATGRTLMPKALDVQTLAVEIQKLHKLQEERKASVTATAGTRKRGPRKATQA